MGALLFINVEKLGPSIQKATIYCGKNILDYPGLIQVKKGIQARGRRTENVVPSPIRLLTDTEPLWARTMCLTMARPRPAPSF
jgi:hypothetical protein